MTEINPQERQRGGVLTFGGLKEGKKSGFRSRRLAASTWLSNDGGILRRGRQASRICRSYKFRCPRICGIRPEGA
jgi:hypothetical protein